jgi:hypothetical protein
MGFKVSIENEVNDLLCMSFDELIHYAKVYKPETILEMIKFRREVIAEMYPHLVVWGRGEREVNELRQS